jgi:hypothetical protein
MELSKLKEQAEINALRKLQIQFNTHDQLEQIDQHMHLNEKRKVNIFLAKRILK